MCNNMKAEHISNDALLQSSQILSKICNPTKPFEHAVFLHTFLHVQPL